MWCELKDKGLITNFTSSIDLLSEFMLYKKQSIEIEGVSNAEIESTLKVLTEHMESRSENSFPGYLVSSLSPKVVASFSSSGILTEADRKLSFGHQIYLDFLIAQRVIFEITDDYSVVDWLESRDKQTLFRREQLRHVLIMLSQDNIGKFISISDLLIKSTEVRFHFKHLVLEVFSSIVDFDQRIYSFLNNLLQNKSWNPHIIHSVVIGNPMYIKELIRNGYIKKMLNSSNDVHINEAIQILRSVNHSIQHEIVCLMKPFIDKGADWYRRILNVIGLDVENDITSMFEFRIELMKRGYYPIFIHWEKFISTDSLRALIVTEVIFNDIEQPPQTRAQKIERHDLEFISKAVKQHPVEAWDKYIPLILKSLKNLEDYEIERLNKSILEPSPLAVAVELTIIASCRIASSQPLTWIEKVNALSHIDSAVIEYIIARGMAHLPNDYADFGIQWLLNNPKRLTAGNSLGEPEYLWSRFIIEKLTPYCNDGNFANLEKLLIYYHEQNELKKARRMLLLRRKSEGGIYYPYWGVPQYLLISKLSPNRVSAYSKELLSILKRKFSDTTDKELMDNNIIHVGVSVSAIGENIDRISDRAWIQIISNNKIPCKGNYTRKYIKEEKIWTESSVWQFSRSLEDAAIMNPARFVKLALSFPDNVHPRYVSAIFAALQSTKNTSTNQKNVDNIYKAASIEDVVSLIEKYQKFENNSAAISFCRLILERNEEDWPQSVLSKLVDLAMFHMDPLPENLNVHHSNWDGKLQNAKIEDIFTSGLNCVRGTAAQAIASILWKKGEQLKFFSIVIESLVTDQHIVVRMAALSILLPVLNINRDLAIQWFRKAVDCDPRIVMSRYGLRIINHTIKSHFSTIAPIIQLMIDSNNADIVIQGAEFITGFWVIYGFFEEELHKCLSGTIDQKKGIVKFATEHLVNFETMEKCKDLLSQLIESDAEELSKELSDLFRYDIMKYPENVELINQYLRSDAFSDSLMIVHSLKEYEGNLLGFSEVVFSLFDAFKRHKNKGENSSYRFRHDVEGAIELLIRLYEQSKNIDSFVFIKCLDTWDMLLEERISEAMVLQQQLNK
jgi:hypothetical protein